VTRFLYLEIVVYNIPVITARNSTYTRSSRRCWPSIVWDLKLQTSGTNNIIGELKHENIYWSVTSIATIKSIQFSYTIWEANEFDLRSQWIWFNLLLLTLTYWSELDLENLSFVIILTCNFFFPQPWLSKIISRYRLFYILFGFLLNPSGLIAYHRGIWIQVVVIIEQCQHESVTELIHTHY
jgi:hypothetical protein